MRLTFASVALLGGLAIAVPSHAGVYADDLSRCLIEKTSKEDRIALVRWLFVAATAHPAVADVVKVSPEQLDQANKTTGELFMRLLTESCVEPVRNAAKYEGPVAFPLSFQVLGQVAGMDLFASPEVTTAMAGLEKYTDKAKLEALMQKKE